MGWSSELYADEPIMNDDPSTAMVGDVSGRGTGLDLSSRGTVEFGYGAAAVPFPPELLIPEHEWQARIKEMEERKTRLSDYMTAFNLPMKNQKSLNYCWVFAPVHCLEVVRLMMGQRNAIGRPVSLSPASVGAQIKGFRNVGGWGKEALEWMSVRGVTPSELWPDTSLERKYLTEAAKEAAKGYVVDEWMELRPRNKAEQVSMLLRRIPIAIGQNHWQHEIMGVDPVWLDGDVAMRIRNQWEGWGVNGFGIQQGSKMLADDAVCPRTALAS